LGQIWTNPNVKNVIKNFTVESESWSWVNILNVIFNPTFGLVHIWTKCGLKQPKRWVKNVIKKFTVESERWSWVNILNVIFNPNFWVGPYLTQMWVETTQTQMLG